jgi:hypothetical protein
MNQENNEIGIDKESYNEKPANIEEAISGQILCCLTKLRN